MRSTSAAALEKTTKKQSLCPTQCPSQVQWMTTLPRRWEMPGSRLRPKVGVIKPQRQIHEAEGSRLTITSLVFAYESGNYPLSFLAKHQLPLAKNNVTHVVLTYAAPLWTLRWDLNSKFGKVSIQEENINSWVDTVSCTILNFNFALIMRFTKWSVGRS